MAFLSECPVCRAPLAATYVFRPLWSQWPCKHCGSVLGIDRTRRAIGILILVPVALASFILVAQSWWGLGGALVVYVGVWWLLFTTLDRVVVVERAGFRCRGCGYELHGLTVPRCPECGRDLNEEERRYLETGEIPPPPGRPRRRWLLTTLLIGFCLLSLLLGLWKWRQSAKRPVTPAPVAPATSQPL